MNAATFNSSSFTLRAAGAGFHYQAEGQRLYVRAGDNARGSVVVVEGVCA